MSAGGCECAESGLRNVAPHLSYAPLAVDFGEVSVGDLRVRGVKLTNEATKKAGGQMLLASLLVAIIGHGLCFFNGLVNFNVH